MESSDIVIVGAARTPIGAFLGAMKDVSAPQLGACAIRGATANSGIPEDAVDEVLMGCVLPAGLGQAPARQAALAAGLPERVPCATVNKMCGSGMKTVMLAHDALRAGEADIVVAGGMESMSNAPYLLERARTGYRMGHGKVLDHMFLDGLEDAYDKGRLMGAFAEDCASAHQFTRDMQDAYAQESLERARRAASDGCFAAEIVPVTTHAQRREAQVFEDELPARASIADIPTLRPAFRPDGTITAASSSAISDGAAALVLTTLEGAERCGVPPRGAIVAHAGFAAAPSAFPTAPIGAIRKLFDKTGWKVADVDLFEINEAFAVVTLVAMRELGISRDNVNVHGGACALGHPIGASGARIVVTLLNALERYGLRRGVAALCIGGGEATALAIERR